MKSFSLVVNCMNTVVLILDEHLGKVDHVPEYRRVLFNEQSTMKDGPHSYLMNGRLF